MRAASQILLLASVFISAPAQMKSSHAVEQRAFNLANRGSVVAHPVALSDAELAVLAKDEMMRRGLNHGQPIAKLTSQDLEAAVVHLHSPQERDLVVVGSGELYMGVNVGPFWVIRELPTGPQVVLATSSMAMEILPRASNGLKEIQLLAATKGSFTTKDLRFDGTKYTQYRDKTF